MQGRSGLSHHYIEKWYPTSTTAFLLRYCFLTTQNSLEKCWLRFKPQQEMLQYWKGLTFELDILWIKYFPVAHFWIPVYVACSFSLVHMTGKIEEKEIFAKIWHCLNTIKVTHSLIPYCLGILVMETGSGELWCCHVHSQNDLQNIMQFLPQNIVQTKVTKKNASGAPSFFGCEITPLLGIDILSLFWDNSESYQGHDECFLVSS